MKRWSHTISSISMVAAKAKLPTALLSNFKSTYTLLRSIRFPFSPPGVNATSFYRRILVPP